MKITLSLVLGLAVSWASFAVGTHGLPIPYFVSTAGLFFGGITNQRPIPSYELNIFYLLADVIFWAVLAWVALTLAWRKRRA